MNLILRELIKKFGTYHLRKGSEYAFKCPCCRDNKYRMDVNLKHRVFYCFHCSMGGPLSKLIDEVQRFTEDTARLKSNPIILANKAIEPPKGFMYFYNSQDKPPQIFMDYFLKRRLSWALDLGGGSWGFCRGNYSMLNRLIIPIYEDKKLVCWLARAVDESKPKELSPSSEISNKSHFFYGLDQVVEGDRVILVEGVFDCVRLLGYGHKAIASLGSNLSDIQVGKLLAKRPSQVIVLYDGDLAGREGARKAAIKLIKRGCPKVREIRLSEGVDPDQLTYEEAQEILKH